ncbi:MAG: class I SAM-dependent methyltransferase [Chloroflexi bacterium]|nr:class I SAM-dependent methyltransferase [Chloroflexota bacterium]
MNNTLYPAPLYTFLSLCQREALPKEVLDCGAGGANPPLNLFCAYGYRAAGVEIDPQRAQLAREAARQHGFAVDIREADMRRLPFADQSFSFVYSYNSVFHLSKADIAAAIAEMRRALRPGGLCYVNFLSVDDGGFGEGQPLEKGEFLQEEDRGLVLHSYFEDDEGDHYFDGMQTLIKEKRTRRQLHSDGQVYRMAFMDYMLRV